MNLGAMAMKEYSTFSNITGASPSDCLISYPRHSWGSYPSAEMQSVYSTVPTKWVHIDHREVNWSLVVILGNIWLLVGGCMIIQRILKSIYTYEKRKTQLKLIYEIILKFI